MRQDNAPNGLLDWSKIDIHMIINSNKRPWEKTGSQGKRHNPDPFYQSKQWRSTRNAFIQANRLCVVCGGQAEMVDHKVRIKEGGSRLDWSNLQSMCNKCHAKKDNNAGR